MFVKLAQGLLTINIQWLLCTVIKFHVDKEAEDTKEAVHYFVQDCTVNFWQLKYWFIFINRLQYVF